MADESDIALFCTVGCHPTHSQEFHPNFDEYYESLKSLIIRGKQAGRVVAVGECGLDYDRVQFCPVAIQRDSFLKQLQLSHDVSLPLFLHCRNTGMDFINIMRDHRHLTTNSGVVHSFTGTTEEMEILTGELGLYIGINGWSAVG